MAPGEGNNGDRERLQELLDEAKGLSANKMLIRDRIIELRRVPAGQLRPNPRNWRAHSEHQRNVLRGVLAEIGYADALIARQLEDGSLELIDGHLRAETTPDMVVPVLVLDVDENEAAYLLATLDPLGSLADADAERLEELLRDVLTSNPEVRALLDSLAKNAGLFQEGLPADAEGKAYDESVANEVEHIVCPNCGHSWPK